MQPRKPPAQFFDPGGRRTRRSASPSSSSRTTKAGCSNPVGSAQGRQGRPAGRAQRQPAGDPAVRPRRPSQRTRSHCPPTSVVGASLVTVAVAGVPVPPVAGPGLQPRPEPGRTGALRLRSASASKRLPQIRRRMERRLPRGLHDRRPRHRRSARIYKNRLVFTGVAGNGTFLTNPSTCHDPSQAAFAAHLLDLPAGRLGRSARPRPSPTARLRFEAALPPGVMPTGCANVPFEPGDRGQPGHRADRLARRRRRRGHRPVRAAAADRQLQRRNRATSRCRSAWASTPPAADELEFCSDDQFDKGTQAAGRLPGRVEDRHGRDRNPAAAARLADRRRLPRQAAQPRPDLRRGVPDLRRRRVCPLRRLGAADRQGQRRPEDRPPDDDLRRQPAGPVHAPSSSQFNEGHKAVLTSAADLRPQHSIHSAMTPTRKRRRPPRRRASRWPRPRAAAPARKRSAERPFAPGFSTTSKSVRAGAFSPFAVHISRSRRPAGGQGRRLLAAAGPDRQAEGRPLLPAEETSPRRPTAPARREEKNPSCPTKSQVGVATIKAGQRLLADRRSRARPTSPGPTRARRSRWR